MKKKLLIGALVAQSLAVLGALVYLFVGVLSPLPVKKAKSAESAEVAATEEAEAEAPVAGKESHEAAEAAKAEELTPLSLKADAGHALAVKPPSHEAPAHEKAKPAHDEAVAAKAAPVEHKAAPAAAAEPAPRAEGPVVLAEAVSSLMDGNERFAQGFMRPRDLVDMRLHPARPSAVVVTCADATVPPELLFDQPLGSLIVVRTAAQLVDEASLAAVEDAVTRQKVPVVVVVGHRHCHAVEMCAQNGAMSPGEATVAARLKPVLAPLRKVFTKDDLLSHAIEANVSFAATQLSKRSKVLRGAHTPVLRVVYDEASGKAAWLDAETSASEDEPHPAERAGRAAH